MAALVIGSTSVVFAADKVDDTVKSTLVTTAEGLTDAIVQLKDEEIENYMSSGDDFTTSAMQTEVIFLNVFICLTSIRPFRVS